MLTAVCRGVCWPDFIHCIKTKTDQPTNPSKSSTSHTCLCLRRDDSLSDSEPVSIARGERVERWLIAHEVIFHAFWIQTRFFFEFPKYL